jgi:hypothetical protein
MCVFVCVCSFIVGDGTRERRGNNVKGKTCTREQCSSDDFRYGFLRVFVPTRDKQKKGKRGWRGELKIDNQTQFEVKKG